MAVLWIHIGHGLGLVGLKGQMAAEARVSIDKIVGSSILVNIIFAFGGRRNRRLLRDVQNT